MVEAAIGAAVVGGLFVWILIETRARHRLELADMEERAHAAEKQARLYELGGKVGTDPGFNVKWVRYLLNELAATDSTASELLADAYVSGVYPDGLPDQAGIRPERPSGTHAPVLPIIERLDAPDSGGTD